MKRPAEEELVGAGKKGPPWPPQAAAAAADDEEEGQQPDDELDAIGIPTGWRQCPSMGLPIDRFIPMKVPLGARFDAYIKAEDRFTPVMAKQMADAAVADRRLNTAMGPIPCTVKMVIDLTKSSRYYDPRLWSELDVMYCKIPCKGRSEAPSPDLVNEFVGEVMYYVGNNPGGMIMVHCTHGFNRTGYMIVSYLQRMLNFTVKKALGLFAQGRWPGIYKHYYIRQLFKYYHEGVPHGFPFPAMPDWKGGDSPEREEQPDEEPQGHMHHEDVIGEPVSLAEYRDVVTFVIASVRGDCNWDGMSEPIFPGSQPVSLDRQNLELLKQIRYWVTWKADGTRYMVAIMRYGTYLVDRKFQVRRVQMRFPTPPLLDQAAKSPVGPPHHMTLLDGEMVVDEDLEGNQQRRFLIYDLVAANRVSMVQRPWKDRYVMIEDLVVKPRTVERHKIEKKEWTFPYQYDKELFRVRRKEFWPLPRADKLLNKFIPNLSHEADGLIFQPYHATYEAGTCPELLKWKFPHMNSVDFMLRVVPGQAQPQLLLLEPRKQSRDYVLRPLEGARVLFPEGDSPELHNGHIVECGYDHEAQAWTYMRTRRDKKLPNAYRVFEKVFSSIQDNITEADILQYVHETLNLPLYNRDMGRPDEVAGQDHAQLGQEEQANGSHHNHPQQQQQQQQQQTQQQQQQTQQQTQQPPQQEGLT